jgi:hypothetical protein
MTTINARFKKSDIGVFAQTSSDSATAGFAKGCHIVGMTLGQTFAELTSKRGTA